MTTLYALILLLTLLVAFVFFKTAFQRRGLRRKVEERFPAANITPVRFTTKDVMAAGQTPAGSAAWGYLVSDAEKSYVIGRVPGSGAIQEFQLEPNARIARIRKVASVPGVPDMIRIASSSSALFLFADKSVGSSKPSTGEIFDALNRRFASEDLKLPSYRLANALLYPLAVLVFLGVSAILYFSVRAVQDFGIDTVAIGSDGKIMASSTRELVVIAPNGSIEDTVDWNSLGVKRGAVDMTVLDDERLLVGDLWEGVIKACHLDRRQCEPIAAFSTKYDLSFRRTFKFALAPDGRTILAADTARHRLLQLDRHTGESTISEQPLCFPNRIRIGPRGQVVVADTNNHRLLEWDSWQTWLDTEPTVHPMAAELPEPEDCQGTGVNDAFMERPVSLSSDVSALEQLRGGRIWPTDFTWLPDGSVWVLLGSIDLRYGDVAIFDADWRFRDKVQVEAGLDTVQVQAWGEEVLLIDPGEDRIPVVNVRGEILRVLSEQGLGAHVDSLREEYQRMRLYGGITQIAVLILFIATLLLAVFSKRRRLRQLADL